LILDSLTQAKIYRAFGAGFAAGFDYLAATDLLALADGRYEIQGSDVFAIVQSYNTKPREQGRWEAHRQYADIQIVVTGRERMGVAPISSLKLACEYDPEKDVAFYDGDGQFFTVGEGSFALFLPHDVHMPSLAIESPGPVKKVVVKVRVT
jgi:biofilm protein TabA